MSETMAAAQPDRAALQAAWDQAWHGLGVEASDAQRTAHFDAHFDALFDALVVRYTEPQRAYHTLQHLGECLAHLDRERAQAERPDEVAMALWFHDAIYDLQGHDNEQRSADWARDALTRAGIAPDAVERVHALIMATRHDVLPVGRDAELLIDIDLSILGASTARFAEYERQIRIEYAHVPPAVFEPRRKRILGAFLAREPLYRTASMRQRLEAQARRNLSNAVR